MTSNAYHIRRIVLSYAFEYATRFISWCYAIKHPFWLNVLFGIACILCGIAFVADPVAMASSLGFTELSHTALVDIRAYYGTMLIALGFAIAYWAKDSSSGRTGLWMIIAVSLGSAAGRVWGLLGDEPLWGVHGALTLCEVSVSALAFYYLKRPITTPEIPITPLNPTTPEAFNPLNTENFRNPYEYYRLLRDEYPLYHFKSQNFYVLSRYDDITTHTKNTELHSNKLVEIIATGKPKDPNKTTPSLIEHIGLLGVIPVDVLAIQDDPIHKEERKISHKLLNAHKIKALEAEVETLCDEMMDAFIHRGTVEFIQEFAWRLPMRLIISMLGFPEKDYEIIKFWCCQSIRSLSGTTTREEQVMVAAHSAKFMRYLWKHYLHIKATQPEGFTAQLAAFADDPDSVMTDQRAVATLHQLLIAGSDSSASTMGSAIKVLAQRPDIEQRLRQNPDDIGLFIDEVLRTEAAFQGHFRLTKAPCEIHGVHLPAATRIFMCWASGNRDERFWEQPDDFNMDRENLKKHLTFGHGVHACVGRELARMENRVVIRKLLEKTRRMEVVGDTPYEASLFARTLLALPLAFEPAVKPAHAARYEPDYQPERELA